MTKPEPAQPFAHIMFNPFDELAIFIKGENGEVAPSQDIVDMATKIVNHLKECSVTIDPVCVDDDGALSFDFRRKDNQQLAMAEYEIDGRFDASIYDEANTFIKSIYDPEKFVEWMIEGKENEE